MIRHQPGVVTKAYLNALFEELSEIDLNLPTLSTLVYRRLRWAPYRSVSTSTNILPVRYPHKKTTKVVGNETFMIRQEFVLLVDVIEMTMFILGT